MKAASKAKELKAKQAVDDVTKRLRGVRTAEAALRQAKASERRAPSRSPSPDPDSNPGPDRNLPAPLPPHPKASKRRECEKAVADANGAVKTASKALKDKRKKCEEYAEAAEASYQSGSAEMVVVSASAASADLS